MLGRLPIQGMKLPCAGDFMTAPVLSAKPHMTEKQVEDLFTRYDVRALPVVDDQNEVIGLVTYKEVAAAKQRLWNKQQKQLRQKDRVLQSLLDHNLLESKLLLMYICNDYMNCPCSSLYAIILYLFNFIFIIFIILLLYTI